MGSAGTTLSPVASALISAISALLGAIIGATAAVGAQFIAQNAIAARERIAQERVEKRTNALFAGYLRALHRAIEETDQLRYWNFPHLRRVLEPPLTMAQQPATMLALNPSAIRNVTAVLAIVDGTIRQAQESIKAAGKTNVEVIGEHTYLRDDAAQRWLCDMFTKPRTILANTIRDLETPRERSGTS